MIIELSEVEIGLLEDALRALEAEFAGEAEDPNPDVQFHGETTIIMGRARRFTLLRAKLAGLPVSDEAIREAFPFPS